MALNIKNERVHDLARQAAKVTGKSQTGAIEEALEQLLLSHGADPEHARLSSRLDVVHQIVAAYQSDPATGTGEIRTPEDLYDATTGLPQ